MKDNKWSPYIRAMLVGFGAISLSVVFFFLLYRVSEIRAGFDVMLEILTPFVYGGVIAYLLRPLCNWYEETFERILPRKMKKLACGIAVTLSILTGILIVYALIVMIAPQLWTSITRIWEALPDKFDEFVSWATTTFAENEDVVAFIRRMAVNTDNVYEEVEKWVTNTVLPYVSSILGGVGDIVSGVSMGVWSVVIFVKNILIGLIVAVYLLAGRKKLAKQGTMLIRATLKKRWADIVLDEICFVDKMFGGFIDGKIVDSAIIGVLCYIGCIIFKFPNALLVSAIVGVTNVIPFFGPFIGGVPATLLIMIDDPIKGLWFGVFVIALQQLDGNVIGPKILGDRTGLSSFWVLFAIVLGGGVLGIFGMVISVPLFAVIYDIIKKLVYRGLRRNGQIDTWEQYKHEFGEEHPRPRSAEPPKETHEEVEKTEKS